MRGTWCANTTPPNHNACKEAKMAVNDFTRFEQKYVRVPFSGCWIWTASLVSRKSQYGRFQCAGRLELAHRASWMLYRGGIPAGMDVCHTCDVPTCVNPDHLFLGTAADNIADRMAKGRPHNVPSGELHYRAKLSPADVVEIRRSYAFGEATQRALAERFNISMANVYYILKGVSWREVG